MPFNPRFMAIRPACLCLLGLGLPGMARAGLPVRLNEVVASNGDSLRDEDGAAPDWIEIQNTGIGGVDLEGCGLSDDPTEPFKWVFPSTPVPSGQFIVVFASGKNRLTSARRHTNFSIGSQGEPLRLTAPDGSVLDSIPAVHLRRDVSYGRSSDGADVWRFFPSPTPGSANTGASFGGLLHQAPAFSSEGGFYADSLALGLSSSEPGTVIRYTLDGSEPADTSPLFDAPVAVASRTGQPNRLSLITGTSTANQHTDGWKPPVGEVRKATVVRARAFKTDALPSPVATHTYFVGAEARRTDGLPVISLATDPQGLFDDTRGIYMLGKIFADYVAAHPGETLTGHTPANYTQRGAAWERPTSLEFFDPAGLRAVAVPVALDIKGQSSRSFRQKTLGVSMGSDGSGDPWIAYPLFPGLRKRGDGQPMESFRRLRLRNAGNDWAYAAMRDGFCHQLAGGLGLDVSAWRPVSLFLDGEYWGVLEMREEQDSRYFEAHYGVDPAAVAILNGDGSIEEGVAGDSEAFLALRTFANTHDLSVPAHYAYVQDRMDVENFLLSQVVEIYCGNADWPQNNVRVWRERRPDPFPDRDTVPRGRDGRWRWLLFDLDITTGHPWSGGYSENSLSFALSPTGRPGTNSAWSTIFLRALIRNPEAKRFFVTAAADLLNSSFKESRATALVDSMKATLQPAMAEHIRRWQSNGNSVATWAGTHVQSVRTFASQRAITVRQHFTSQLALGGYAALTVAVEPAAAGSVQVNRLHITSDLPGAGTPVYPWKGTYFRNVPVALQARPSPGFVFSGWTTPAGEVTTSIMNLTLTGATTVTARFDPAPLPMGVGAVELLTDGSLRLVFAGAPNAPFAWQFSTDLITWGPGEDFITDAAGHRELIVPAPSLGAAAGYFRVAARE